MVYIAGLYDGMRLWSFFCTFVIFVGQCPTVALDPTNVVLRVKLWVMTPHSACDPLKPAIFVQRCGGN